MRFVKTVSMLLVLGTLTASSVAAEYNRFGKGPTTTGLTPPGYSTSGGYIYSRQYVQPAPVVATAPATDGRRAFSAEPSTTQRAAPAVGVMAMPRTNAPEYNRFGKGALSIGATPPGVR
jgi:hypothetical protein